MHIRIVRYAIKIGYDGSHFNGFAMQPGKKTVEGEILKRLIKTKMIEDRKQCKFQYAARTDKGVSAFGNVIALNAKVNPAKVLQGMDDIWVTGYAIVEKNFNPRHASYKIYRYYLPNEGYDVEKIKKAAELFEGEHDFSSFARKDSRNTRRKIYRVEVKERKAREVIKIDFIAPSFLWNQVRRMVAALAAVGKERASIEDIKEALNGKRVNFGLMEARNLVLLDVIYDIKFEKILPAELAVKKEIYKDAFDYISNATHSWNVGFRKPVE